MAVRYAVATGNWSSTSTWNGGTLPTSSDDVYSNGFTVTIDQNITVLSISNAAQSPAVAGGGFNLNNSITINCTGSGITNANTTCITFGGTGTSYINANITLNGSANCINISSTGTLYVVGNILGQTGNGFAAINAQTNNSNCYITGTIRANGSPGVRAVYVSNGATVYITGNVSVINYGNGASAIGLGANAKIYITGNVYYENDCFNASIINTTANVYLNIVGTINANTTNTALVPAVTSTSVNSTNLFSGPFICGTNAIMPIYVTRMNYIKTIGSYFEFRDSSTNGALPPFSSGAAARLVSPDTVVDSPLPANVRYNIVYANGSLTGTLKVPNPNQVAYGIETDNTTGNAVLTPTAVWNHLISNISTAGSIGERLKNAATVQTTGDQITSLN